MFRKILRVLGLPIFFMLINSSVMAAESSDITTVYTMGNGYFISNVFQSVALVFGGDNGIGSSIVIQIVKIFGLIGFIFFLFKSVFFGNPFQLIRSWIGALILAAFFIVPPPQTVSIQNVGVGEGSNVYTVDNVPFGIAMTASILSKVGYSISEKFNMAFGVTDLNGYDANQLLKLFNSITKAGNDPNVTAILSNYSNGYNVVSSLKNHLAECTFLKIEKGLLTADQLLAQDIMDMMNTRSNLFGTALVRSNGRLEYLTCSQSSDKIKEIVEDIKNDLNGSGKLSAYMKKASGINNNDTSNIASLAGKLLTGSNLTRPHGGVAVNELEDHLINGAVSAQNFILSSIVSNIYDKAASYKYRSYFDTQMAVMVEQARIQRNTQWQGEGILFIKTMAPLMSFFEGFVYAIAPFMILMLMLGLYGLVLKYFTLLIWLQLWLPINSIINLYIFSGIRSDISGLYSSTGGALPTSIYGFFGSQSILSDWVSVGGMLTASVPIISLFVLTGSTYTFTTLASRLSGGDHIDEKQVAPSMSQVGSLITAASMTGFNRTTGSTKTGADSMVPVIRRQDLIQNQLSADYKEAVQAANSLQDAITNGLSTSSQSSLMSEAATSYMNDTSSSTSAGRSFIQSKAKMLQDNLNLSHKNSMEIAAMASAGISLSAGVAKAQFGVSTKVAKEISAAMATIQSEAKSQNLSDDISIGLSEKMAAALGGKNSEGHSYMEGVSNVDAITKAASHVKSAAKTYSKTFSRSSSVGMDASARLDALTFGMSESDKYEVGKLQMQFNQDDRAKYNENYKYFSGIKGTGEQASLMAILYTAYNSKNSNIKDQGIDILEKQFTPMNPGDNATSENENQINAVSGAKFNEYFSDKESGIGKIGDLNERESDILANAIKMRESSGRYNLTNNRGYLGAYQFGAQRLQDLGYIKKGVNFKNKSVRDILSNADNWTGLNGINSQEDFLANKAEQDRAFERHINGLWNQNKAEYPNASKAELAGRVMASHLLGFDGAKDLNKVDGNKVSGAEYFNIGKGVIEKAGYPDIDDDSVANNFEAKEEIVGKALNKGQIDANNPTPVSDNLKNINKNDIAKVIESSNKNKKDLDFKRITSLFRTDSKSDGAIAAEEDYNKYKSYLEQQENLSSVFGYTFSSPSYSHSLERLKPFKGVPLGKEDVTGVIRDFKNKDFNLGEIGLAEEIKKQITEGKGLSDIKESKTYKEAYNNLATNANSKYIEAGGSKSAEFGSNYAKYIEQTIENTYLGLSSKGEISTYKLMANTDVTLAPGGKAAKRNQKNVGGISEYSQNLSQIESFYKSFEK